jgi:hypothetical protein
MQLFLASPDQAEGRGGYGNADFLALRQGNKSFEKVAAFSKGNRFGLTGRGTPSKSWAQW